MNTILEEGHTMLSTEWCWDTMLATEHNDATAQHNVDNGTQWHGGTAQWQPLLARTYNLPWQVTMVQFSGSWCTLQIILNNPFWLVLCKDGVQSKCSCSWVCPIQADQGYLRCTAPLHNLNGDVTGNVKCIQRCSYKSSNLVLYGMSMVLLVILW